MRAIISAACLFYCPVLACADTVEIQLNRPVAEFAVPDDWETKRIERGIQCFSPDYEVYIWIEAYQPGELQQILAEHSAYWKKQGITVASSDEHTHQENGREVSVTTEHATWNGKPTVLYYVEYRLGLPSRSNILFTYWASAKGDKAFQKEIGEVLGSLKVTEK